MDDKAYRGEGKMKRNVDKRKIYEKLIGDSAVMEKRLKNLYGEGFYEKERICIQNRNRKFYILVLVIVFLILTLVIISSLNNNSSFVEDKDGNILSITRPDENMETVSLTVIAEKNGEKIKKEIILDIASAQILHEKEIKQEEYKKIEESLESKLMNHIDTIGKEYEGKNVKLPSKLDDGTKITWKENSKIDLLPILMLATIMVGYVFIRRFSELEIAEKQAEISIIKDLPGFLNKISLLMSAGLVFSSAFKKIINERRNIEWDGDSYFYSQLLKIDENVRNTKSSLQNELTDFSVRSGNREFIRTVSIICDNINKGTVLTDKLRGESEAMWFAQKKYIEEKGKIAETKLIGPLVILLLVLVVITVAPALMEM